jgi:hypothetical protein
MTTAIIIVQSEPVKGREKEYEQWYTEQHLSDVVSVPGFVSASLYVASDAQREGVPAPAFGHVAIYQVDCPPDVALANLNKARDEGLYVSPAMRSELLLHAFELVAEIPNRRTGH